MARTRGSGGDYARLEALLAEAGLTMPPMPEAAEARLKEREEWCFSTRAFKVSPSDLQYYVRKAIGEASPDYVLVAQVGRGTAASMLHYYLVQGPLQLFLQLDWGGTSTDRANSAAAVNDCFALAHELVAAVPQALWRGRLSREGRLTVVASDFGEGFWEVAQAGERGSRPGRPPRGKSREVPNPREVLEDAVRWCRGKMAD